MILLSRVNISLECGMCRMHDLSLLTYMLSCLPCRFVFFSVSLCRRVLLLQLLINCNDFLLKNRHVLLDRRLTVLDEEVDLSDVVFLCRGRRPWRFSG